MAQAINLKSLKSTAEIESIRNLWERWQMHPYSDIDFFLTIVNARRDNTQPYVIFIGSAEDPLAIAVGRLEENEIQIRLGYKVLLGFPLKTIVIVHDGFLGEQTEENSSLLIKALQQSIKECDAEAVRFEPIDMDSAIARSLQKNVSFFCREHFVTHRTHWKMNLSSQFEDILARLSRDHRNQLRRKSKKLEKDFAPAVRAHCFRTVAELDQMFMDVEDIARQTYQRGLGVGFIDNPENRNRLMLEAERGWLRMYVLYLNEKPCAYWWGVLYGDTLHSIALGYASEFQNYSTGTYILLHGIEDLCQDGVKMLDFGLGDARYKQQFGDINYHEAPYTLFAPTFKGIGINMILTLTNGFNLMARRILSEFKMIDAVKRYWRTKLKSEFIAD